MLTVEHPSERMRIRRSGPSADSVTTTDVERDGIDRFAEQALNDGSLIGNPCATEYEDLIALLERTFDGELCSESTLRS